MFKKIAFVTAALAMLLVCLPTTAKPKKDKKVVKFDAEVTRIIKDQALIGANVIVIRDGKVIYTRSEGVANQKRETPMTADHILRLGANGRIFPVIATLQLVDQNLVSLNADASDYLGFQLRNPRYPDLPITVKMLLTNTSTVGDSNKFLSIDYINPEKNPDYAEAYRPTGKPGVAYFSSPRNASLLAAIVERVSGMRFDEYLKANLFDPMGMDSACYDVTGIDRDRFIGGYNWSESENRYLANVTNIYKKLDFTDYVLGDSSMLLTGLPGLGMSTNDFAKVVAALMNGGVCPFNQVRILSAESVQEMLRLRVNKKRSGMFIGTNSTDVEGYTVYIGTGVTYGLSCVYAFNLTDNIAVIGSCTGGHDPAAPKGRNTFNRDIRKAFVTIFAN